jgi:hypothetical protein
MLYLVESCTYVTIRRLTTQSSSLPAVSACEPAACTSRIVERVMKNSTERRKESESVAHEAVLTLPHGHVVHDCISGVPLQGCLQKFQPPAFISTGQGCCEPPSPYSTDTICRPRQQACALLSPLSRTASISIVNAVCTVAGSPCLRRPAP